MNAKLDDLAVLDEKGTLNDQGLGLLANLLEHLPRVHEGRWKEAFVPMVSKLVRVCVDLAVIRGHKVLMKWRDDEFFKGWECPGGSLGPGESWKDAAERFGQKEFGIKVCFLGKLETFNNTDNPKAQDVTVLLLCEPLEEPREGQWFDHRPENMIPVHLKYWPEIVRHL
ncbi:hypothetical protein A3G54_04290 [Candidatus Giovannonibacteria bacterium RIFCSPLOWO2_12_FULL_44_15]|uniref:Nudix hydrolase domain-containing protein n=1 Tax=Candidatus Giovannonibacteria bacterium RIFCSPLOWO2_12_FULL_44_15 TaxID=1798364 RepID=A0A1F5Y1L1_9BACT|nr:MAG: hypothetical protein A3G54_04290 [Candidatus Giovannonibacteria bacterium RIFCSPLOWO2_12_FULL_44_15]